MNGDPSAAIRRVEVQAVVGLVMVFVAAAWSVWPYWLTGPPQLSTAGSAVLLCGGGFLLGRFASRRIAYVGAGVLVGTVLGASIIMSTFGRSAWLEYMANTPDAADFNAPSPWVSLAASLGSGLMTAAVLAAWMLLGVAGGALLDRRTPNKRIEQNARR